MTDDTTTKSPRRGRPPKTSLQDKLEASVALIDTELAKFVAIFDDKDAGKIRDVERMATFTYLRQRLEKISAHCARSHENARLTTGAFSLADAAARYREPAEEKLPAPIYAPAPPPMQMSAAPAAPLPEGFIPVHLRKPHLVYDEITGRAIGRKSAAEMRAEQRPDPLADAEAGFIKDNSGD